MGDGVQFELAWRDDMGETRTERMAKALDRTRHGNQPIEPSTPSSLTSLHHERTRRKFGEQFLTTIVQRRVYPQPFRDRQRLEC